MDVSPQHCLGALATGILLLLLASAPNADVPPDSTAKTFLDDHNAFRARSGLPPLEWNNEVASFAADYANKRKADCALEHSEDGYYGENIFQGDGDQWQPADAVKSWADDEMKFYDPKKNECVGGECSHYTQVVWRNTTKLGCARVVCDNKAGVFMNCNYDPAGNIIGQSPFEISINDTTNYQDAM